MTELSQIILSEYQVRKSKKDKARFEALLKEYGVDYKVDSGGILKSRNLIVGDPENAKVLLTAHYDTCARLPLQLYMFPMNFLLSLLGSLPPVWPIVLAILLTPSFVELLISKGILSLFSGMFLFQTLLLGLLVLLFVLMLGPIANPHTANDNTSGVITLVELLDRMDEETKKNVAFIFFDNEEYGLFGSSFHRKRYKAQIKNQFLINFDCVSDGDQLLLVYNKGAKEYLDRLTLEPRGYNILVKSSSRAFFTSDQMGFPKAVAVAFLRKGPLGPYLARIHTVKDTVFQEENIDYLCDNFLAIIPRLT